MPQHKDCFPQTKLSSEWNSRVENIFEDEEMNESNSEHDEDEKAECNDTIADIDKENTPKYSMKLDGKTIDNNVIHVKLHNCREKH